MRISRAIDRFLEQMQLEDDFTDRSLESYLGVLGRLVDAPPRGFGNEARLTDFEGRDGTEKLRSHIGHNWGRTSSGRRANVISVHHSFWGWAYDEGFIETDPSARIKRPPRRRPNVYRPPLVDLELGYRATSLHERGPWILMQSIGLRASTVCALRWCDIDLRRGRIDAVVKGGHRLELALSPVAIDRLRDVYRQLAPEHDDHVFTVEVTRFVGNQQTRKIRDPKKPAKPKALWAMVGRICKRAGVRPFGPHGLRHGFANDYLRSSGRDMKGLQHLLGHSSIQTTEGYVDDIAVDDQAELLRRAFGDRVTSVAWTGDNEADQAAEALADSDGPGRNRTCESGPSADVADADRAAGGTEPRPTDEKGCH